ncbi:MAG: ABC transporter substrate-binding protein [Oscillospiraceae bacterium]
MRRSFFEKSIAALLAAALMVVLSGCSEELPEADEETPADTAEEPEELPKGYSQADSIFSINYSASSSLNPFTGTNIYNDQLFSLVYEGLFALDSGLNPRNVLCDSFETSDGVTYIFTLKPNVVFHDGSKLTAEDAAYSINAARTSTKYSSRLSCIKSAAASGELQVTVTLYSSNYSLPSLLDTPIVPYGTAGEEQPCGTGPYRLSGTRLTAFSGYRDYGTMGLKTIYLQEVETEKLAEAFSCRDVDVVGYDPTGIGEFNIHMVHETRYYETTNLIYVGFNTASGVTQSASVRRMLGYLIDTDTICESIFNSAVLKSPLILSPVLDVYDEEWEAGTGYSRQEFLSAASDLGMADTDGDGYYELNGNFTLKFIVNSENSFKVSAAQRIATDMKNMGVSVELYVLSWEDYSAALSSGNFSMFLGEVKLRADFDLTSLLTEGGSLNYTRINDENYGTLISYFLGAGDAGLRAHAACALCSYVKEQAPIIPIAYKEYAVLSHVGVVSGAEPSQSGIYCGAAGWSFNLQ